MLASTTITALKIALPPLQQRKFNKKDRRSSLFYLPERLDVSGTTRIPSYAFLAQALQWPLPATCLPANREQPPAAESGLPW
jgi:hypothetical protein